MVREVAFDGIAYRQGRRRGGITPMVAFTLAFVILAVVFAVAMYRGIRSSTADLNAIADQARPND